MSFQFHRYALPLIQGEVQVPFENGLPPSCGSTRCRWTSAPAYEV
jgi:hypothetical protein